MELMEERQIFRRLIADLRGQGFDDTTLQVFSDDVEAGESVVGVEQLAATIIEYDMEIDQHSAQVLREIAERWKISDENLSDVIDKFADQGSVASRPAE
ncbi:hypothetical protein LQ327_24845 [Actinomycetospora endophytica]|uniref:MafI family immunity protein n=1 Tax=Actinomycetospora endophytica TaxID=2291215 RepID=A0ABS8PE99_9PSEU|nr:hypothetical protein [Actinomycetospora endophytica]MCD2196605.1 hypothetical protein [Actinomycetospora endophytica]